MLENAPYGPNVEEAKVRPGYARLLRLVIQKSPCFVEFEPANTSHHLEQHESHGHPGDREGTISRCARYSHEVLVQGHGSTRVGGCEW